MRNSLHPGTAIAFRGKGLAPRIWMSRYFMVWIFASMLLTPLKAEADVTLLWDSNIETDLAGYQIGYGLAPGQYTALVDVGNRTLYRFTDLQADQTYYFAVRAYNLNGLSSPFSDEVAATISAPVDLQLTNLFANYQSPTYTGFRIVFSALASGGTMPYQYKWVISNSSAKRITQNWSSDNTLVWTPSKQGSYTITAWVRSATNTANAPENAASARSMPFDIVRQK